MIYNGLLMNELILPILSVRAVVKEKNTGVYLECSYVFCIGCVSKLNIKELLFNSCCLYC
jgi:hypothetical protein